MLRVGNANTCYSCLPRVNADFVVLCQVFISFSQPLLSTRHVLHICRVVHKVPLPLFTFEEIKINKRASELVYMTKKGNLWYIRQSNNSPKNWCGISFLRYRAKEWKWRNQEVSISILFKMADSWCRQIVQHWQDSVGVHTC